MKTAILTASIVTNLFLGVAVYGFTTGQVELAKRDYLMELASK